LLWLNEIVQYNGTCIVSDRQVVALVYSIYWFRKSKAEAGLWKLYLFHDLVLQSIA